MIVVVLGSGLPSDAGTLGGCMGADVFPIAAVSWGLFIFPYCSLAFLFGGRRRLPQAPDVDACPFAFWGRP
eukprot:11731868-Ditylum_brightwellii.AAC.1